MAAKSERKAREQKQKIALAAGTVLLLALLGIQGPKTLKALHGGGNAAAVAAATTTTASGTTPTGTPASSTSGAPPSSPAVLKNSDPAPPVGLDSLPTLTLFHAKDPFKPQVDASATPPGAGQTSGQPATPQGAAPVLGTVQTTAPGLKVATIPQATLRVQGKKVDVPLGKSFSVGSVSFRVAGFEPGAVKLAVVGGSFADGTTTLTLQKGQPITLVNTADGSRFSLALLKISSTSAAAVAAATTTPTTTTPTTTTTAP
jgi:hypothetical protein